MSILVKGLQKPKDCYSCPFEHNGWPDEWEMHCLLLDRQVGYFGKKLKEPKDCPIVEVPTPHGRLIDADEVPYFASSPWKAIATQSEIEKMPTIIEAEEGEGHE